MKTLNKIASIFLLVATLTTTSCKEKEIEREVLVTTPLTNTTWRNDRNLTREDENGNLHNFTDTYVIRFETGESGTIAWRRIEDDGTYIHSASPFTYTLNGKQGTLLEKESGIVYSYDFTYNLEENILTVYHLLLHNDSPLVFSRTQ